MDDKHFLTTTYEASIHMEQRKALEELQTWRKEKEYPNPRKDSDKTCKGQGEKKGPRPSGKIASGDKAKRPKFGKPRHWKSKEVVLAGVPTKGKKEYGASWKNYWRCGRSSLKTFKCYTGAMMGGTALPMAPWKAVSSAKQKWDKEAVETTLTLKQAKTTAIKKEDENVTP